MSLPPALLQRLAQRGLVQKQNEINAKEAKEKRKKTALTTAENEEVIAEDYDEMEEEPENPSQYESADTVKRPEENFWLERMKLRIGEAGSFMGHKGCPNKYNIYHKCTLYCVNRWADGHTEPARDYIKRFKRLLRRYPLPKGWSEMYDPGCGCFYFYSSVDNMVSWLPPTHPKSEITKCAAAYRRQLDDASAGGVAAAVGSSDDEEHTEDDEQEIIDARHQRDIDEIIKLSLRSRSPTGAKIDFPSLQDIVAPPVRKQKTRDLEKTLSRQRRERERDRERVDRADKERELERGHGRGGRRHGNRGSAAEALDPMDPSAYSDTPRGKWSDGLNVGGGAEERKKSNADKGGEQSSAGKAKAEIAKCGAHSDDDNDDEEA